MADKPVVNQHQPSLSEWFAELGEAKESEAFREEDNRKADRSEILFQIIGLPYERPEKFSGREVAENSGAFAKILATRGDEPCALRLVPKTADLPKLRTRGLSISAAYETWWPKQQIDPDKYDVYVCPHSDELLWSAIFIINEQGMFGEIIPGLHMQLTQGVTEGQSIQFQYDFATWSWSRDDEAAKREVTRMVALLKVEDSEKQNSLQSSLTATFSHNYLQGYFEATVWPDDRVYVIDYNRLLPDHIPTPSAIAPPTEEHALLRGAVAQPGEATGNVIIVTEENLSNVNFPEGSILVCDNTDVRFLPYMQRAAAIVTNRGGILSHAAIIARELKKPCVIGTQNATTLLRYGDTVTVDATRGTIQKV